MNRRAAFTPLHHPNCEPRPVFPGALKRRTLKRHECRAPESQRDSVPKPRVARHELPWVWVARRSQPQRGCVLHCPPIRRNPVGVDGNCDSCSQGSSFLATLGRMPLPRWGKPIPAVPSEQHKPVERLVERILAAKQKNPAADTSALEREIDQQVYALYGLTPEEIKIVEAVSK